VRGAGFDQEGKWDTIVVGTPGVDPQPFQLNLSIFGTNGTLYTRPVFAATPPVMRLNNTGVLIANYVLDPSVPVGGTRCPLLGDR
jgi:hypothetical protein